MADEATNRQCFHIQAAYCRAMDAPITARLCTALATALTRDSASGRRVLDWQGDPVADAVALRLVGGLHALYRDGNPSLAAVFAGRESNIAAIVAILAHTLVAHDAALMPWLDGPPQTNEPMRSGALMTGLLHLARRYGPRLELLEIGSSAGLNLLIDRYRFDLGGVTVGPTDAPIVIAPAWRGAPPPDAAVEIVSTCGVDIAPLDVTDPGDARRLRAYVWIDATERQERIGEAIAMVRRRPVALETGDAVDWLATRLAKPQPAGVMRVLLHSVVWQYLGDARRERIGTLMADAGARATAERPLGWIMMEPDRVLNRQEVRVRGWPGNTGWRRIGIAHAHGAWVEGLAEPEIV